MFYGLALLERTGRTLCRSERSRLRWASSCLNRSTQVSWVVSWKACRRGVLFSFENLMINRTFSVNLRFRSCPHVAAVVCFPGVCVPVPPAEAILPAGRLWSTRRDSGANVSVHSFFKQLFFNVDWFVSHSSVADNKVKDSVPCSLHCFG